MSAAANPGSIFDRVLELKNKGQDQGKIFRRVFSLRRGHQTTVLQRASRRMTSEKERAGSSGRTGPEIFAVDFFLNAVLLDFCDQISYAASAKWIGSSSLAVGTE